MQKERKCCRSATRISGVPRCSDQQHRAVTKVRSVRGDSTEYIDCNDCTTKQTIVRLLAEARTRRCQVLRVQRDSPARLVGFDACSSPPPRKALGSARKSLVVYTLGIAGPLCKTGDATRARECSNRTGLGPAATYGSALLCCAALCCAVLSGMHTRLRDDVDGFHMSRRGRKAACWTAGRRRAPSWPDL